MRLFFEDEARLGLPLPRYRRVRARGVTPKQPYEPLYDSYGRYGAVEPRTGERFYLERPTLAADCFTVFLGESARTSPDSLNGGVLDNAPGPIGQAVGVPENVVLLHLPPYCPELNPVERVWLAVRERIDVYDEAVRTDIAALREHVAQIVRRFSDAEVADLTGYGYMLDAVRAL